MKKEKNIKKEVSSIAEFYKRPLYYLKKFDTTIYVVFFLFLLVYFIVDYIITLNGINGLTKALVQISYLAIGYMILSRLSDKHKNRSK